MKCAICHTDIKGQYLIDAWGQSVCAEHKTEFCSSCGRFVASTDLHLTDGRCLCSYCKPSVVSLPQHVEWVEKRVRAILSSRGIMDIPAGIPIKIVTPNEMAHLNGSRQLNLFQPGLTQTTKLMGLFMSSCKTHHLYIRLSSEISVCRCIGSRNASRLAKRKRHLASSCLYRRILQRWFVCGYEAINTDLSRFFIKRLEEDPSSVYGDGFRKVVAVYKQKMNLQEVIYFIKK